MKYVFAGLLAIALLSELPSWSFSEKVVTDSLGAKPVATSPASLLKGELSGVRISAVDGNPNGHLNVNIRGLNTLRGDSQPLWIVDGAVIGSGINRNLNAFYLAGGKTINGDKLPDYSGRSYAAPLGNFGWLNPYEVESIEVVKDMSAAARYGMNGANGVVIVRTRKPVSGDNNIWLASNVGATVPSLSGKVFKPGLMTTHDLGISGLFGTGSFYNISGFIRYDGGAVENASSLSGGMLINLETVANERFKFGLTSRFAYGQKMSVAGTNFIGQPSTILLSRRPEMFESEKIDNWLSSYDDEAFDYRTVNTVWLGINFHKTLKLRLTGGIDYQNQTRLIWYGTGTSFGKEFKGATSVIGNSLLTCNFDAELRFERNFAVRHRLQAVLDFELNANADRTNTMCGTNFDLPHLRGKGLSSSSSLHAIRKFSRTYSRMGGYAYVSYDYDGCAGLSGTARFDRTDRFDREPVWFPSAEAFIDLKKLFLMESSGISWLKLRGGYGCAGKEMVLPYEYISAYVSDIPEVEAGAEPYFDGMNRLMSNEYNVGLDLGFLGGRFALSFGYYDKSTEDAFRIYDFGKIVSGLWVVTDKSEIYHERASMLRNRGFELDFTGRFIQTRNIVWTARFNAAYNMNRILSLHELDANPRVEIEKGTCRTEFNVDRTVSEILGCNTLPKVSGGFGTTLSLYGITLDADFSAAAGFSILDVDRYMERGLGRITEGDVVRGDYLRLDNLTVSYSIPLKVRWMQEFKINLSGHNLFTLTGYSGWNPDVNCFGVSVAGNGVDYGSYPAFRQVVLGVSFRF